MRVVDAWLGVAKSVARIVLGKEVREIYEENKRLKAENRELKEVIEVLKADCSFALAISETMAVAVNSLRKRLYAKEEHVCKPGSAGKCCM